MFICYVEIVCCCLAEFPIRFFQSYIVSEAQSAQEQELSNEAVQTLDVMWYNIQHGLVRQVADYFTDLIGPIKNLQEATSAVPVDECAYQQAADTFLVSLFSFPF